MSKQKTLKIKKPKLGGAWGIILGSVLLSCSLGVLMFFVVSYYSDPEHTLSIDFLGISADFFKTAEKSPEIEDMDGLTLDSDFFKFGSGQDSAATTPADKNPKTLSKAEAEKAIELAKIQAENKALKAKNQGFVQQQKAEKERQQEILVRQGLKLSSDDQAKSLVPVKTFSLNDWAGLLNETRRGTVSISLVSEMSGLNVKKKETNVIQEHQFWREDATEASKPIDMTRVLHVAKHIPAILENRINSQLPGKIIAQISENVYGGHGRTILIPADYTR